MLRRVGVGAGEQHAEVGGLATRRPHLLPGDHPLVAVALGLRLHRREVGAGARLGEQLAPALAAVDDREQVALLLLVGAVRVDRGAGEQHAETGGRSDGAAGTQALGDGAGELAREPAPVATPPATSARPSRPRRGAPTTRRPCCRDPRRRRARRRARRGLLRVSVAAMDNLFSSGAAQSSSSSTFSDGRAITARSPTNTTGRSISSGCSSRSVDHGVARRCSRPPMSPSSLERLSSCGPARRHRRGWRRGCARASARSGGVFRYSTTSGSTPRSDRISSAPRDLLHRGLWKTRRPGCLRPSASGYPRVTPGNRGERPMATTEERLSNDDFKVLGRDDANDIASILADDTIDFGDLSPHSAPSAATPSSRGTTSAPAPASPSSTSGRRRRSGTARPTSTGRSTSTSRPSRSRCRPRSPTSASAWSTSRRLAAEVVGRDASGRRSRSRRSTGG